MSAIPLKLAVDANGFVWRVYSGHWSMAPSNPDNEPEPEPVPEPITYYEPTIGQTTDGSEYVLRSDAMADLETMGKRQSHWLGRALRAEGALSAIANAEIPGVSGGPHGASAQVVEFAKRALDARQQAL
jgi:hypothetical protein